MNKKCINCLHCNVCKDTDKMERFLDEMKDLDKKYEGFAQIGKEFICPNYLNIDILKDKESQKLNNNNTEVVNQSKSKKLKFLENKNDKLSKEDRLETYKSIFTEDEEDINELIKEYRPNFCYKQQPKNTGIEYWYNQPTCDESKKYNLDLNKNDLIKIITNILDLL